jgi:hypothetical protein
MMLLNPQDILVHFRKFLVHGIQLRLNLTFIWGKAILDPVFICFLLLQQSSGQITTEQSCTNYKRREGCSGSANPNL